ncbi:MULTISPECIES: hypothetical protein [unclassified Streptomyces]|uniref:hypothetical protein n=1 Tax=unclassified Streptomyces TaxID=2593676 RepID=UPI000BACC57A|nr:MULTISPECIES: hypothetical protein [unclassified Streptomyces]ASY31461.1 hypothetical protein CAC01_01175 [Streptomyces sp. CLI2509]MYX19908.1 hypothetical protein [Streptomyces sp. SID8380]
MSTTRHTTRHHLNRQRRLAAVTAQTTRPAPGPRDGESGGETLPGETGGGSLSGDTAHSEPVDPGPDDPEAAAGTSLSEPSAVAARAARPLGLARGVAALCLLTLLLGAFAGWATTRADALRDTASTRNTALTDAARTSEVKGQAEKAVDALFSYDHADPGAMDKATARWLTGKAVAQHRTLLAPVLAAAGKQKTVVTTTATDSAVERIEGDRARVLVFADQSSTSTAAKAPAAANYAGAMLAVDLVRREGRWQVSALDTFGG